MEDRIVLSGIRRVANLLRQEQPIFCYGTDLEIAEWSMFYVLGHQDYGLDSEVLDGEATIESLEKAYEKGWAAIINDGKLLGFRKEKSL